MTMTTKKKPAPYLPEGESMFGRYVTAAENLYLRYELYAREAALDALRRFEDPLAAATSWGDTYVAEAIKQLDLDIEDTPDEAELSELRATIIENAIYALPCFMEPFAPAPGLAEAIAAREN